MAKLVSKVYGDALFETAMEKELVDTFYEETSALLPILQANPELFSLLGNPQIVKEEKVALLHQVFSGKIAEELMGFLSIIVEKDRQNEMISILQYFIQRVKEFKKIGAAYVTSAVELGAEQKAALEKRGKMQGPMPLNPMSTSRPPGGDFLFAQKATKNALKRKDPGEATASKGRSPAHRIFP